MGKMKKNNIKEKKTKLNLVKKYTSEDITSLFKNVVMLHLVSGYLLAIYIMFRWSLLEGIIATGVLIVLSYLINKRAGLI